MKMKYFLSFGVALLLCFSASGQRTIQLRNLWAVPEVHVVFNGYKLSFTIKDINKTLLLLAGTGDTTWGLTSGLDTALTYNVEVYEKRQMYNKDLQEMMQNAVGPFLLMSGHAQVRRKGRRKLKSIIADIEPVNRDDHEAYIRFYDPRKHKMIFCGYMAVDMYRKDLGIW